VKFKVLLRALFPRKILRHPSTSFDVGYFLFNIFLFGLLFGWAIISHHGVMTSVEGGLVSLFGEMPSGVVPDLMAMIVLTVALFVAYEFGYWLDHYLSHTVPFLWEFHKVHHTAEVLTPLTNARVHPIDSLMFVNILVLCMGTTSGVLNFLFGKAIAQFSILNVNVLVVASTYLISHLHHTQFWIAFTGVWGRLFISPAHHQIHHSAESRHFNKNFGGVLAIFDWIFGTLHMPGAAREKFDLGVREPDANPHTVTEGFAAPFFMALYQVGRWAQTCFAGAVLGARARQSLPDDV
jgi:sterol desaturase/sphingolipid hydroxylase (fatty acid hydroxylase superfamily)